MTADLDLPPVHTALLDADTFAALRRDLALTARVLDVRVKSHATSHASNDSWSLEAACSALGAGRVRGVQVRYMLGAEIWRDTLMLTPEGMRLVRIREPV